MATCQLWRDMHFISISVAVELDHDCSIWIKSLSTFLFGDHRPKATSDRCHGGGEGRSLALKIRLDVEGLQVHPKALRIIFCALQWSLRFCSDGFPSTAKGWGSECDGLGINKSGEKERKEETKESM